MLTGLCRTLPYCRFSYNSSNCSIYLPTARFREEYPAMPHGELPGPALPLPMKLPLPLKSAVEALLIVALTSFNLPVSPDVGKLYYSVQSIAF